MATRVLPSNRYRKLASDSIVYSIEKTYAGWRIQASTPKNMSTEDRIKVVDWFKNYASSVRRLHPLWITTFHTGEHGYVLNVKPISNSREVVEQGQDLKSIWTDEVATRA